MRPELDADAQVFAELYEQTSRRVYAYARRHSDPETAEQVLSDTFLAAWRHRDRLPDPPLPWLLRTAANALLTQRRSRRRWLRLAGAAAFDPSLVTHQPSAESEAIDRQHLLAALGLLSVDDREALLLVAWEGLDYPGAAHVLGISRNAFAARLHRARRRLSGLIGDDPDPVRPRPPLNPQESIS